MKPEIVAWHKQPEPKGTFYFATDLASAETVGQLFTGCRNSEAYITSDGWKTLFANYSLQELVQLCSASGWILSEQGTGAVTHLVYQALLAGYDPLSNQKGDYDVETSEFITLSGNVSKIDWKSLEG